MLKFHLQTITVPSGGSPVITFSNIPQDYNDLLLVTSVRTEAADDNLYIRFDNITSGYTHRNLLGTGSSALSQTQSNQQPGIQIHGMIGSTANTFGNGQAYISNYTSSGNKIVSSEGSGENNASLGYNFITAGVWANSTAIDTITLYPQGGTNFSQNSSVSLYGIRRGADSITNGPATGGTITTSGGFTIHTFTGSGTFTANRNLDIEYLVVGGGGGGAAVGGGGGAGGYRCSVVGENSGGGASAEPRLSVTAGTSYVVTVGAGGAGNGTDGPAAFVGSSSAFGPISAAGGGAGAGFATNALPGGSGGGSRNGSGAQGSGVTGQGFSGGFSFGGGGGASAAGANGNGGTTGGVGGNGVVSSITGAATTRAGGGGSGSVGNSNAAGGTGGGGTGHTFSSAGAANFGGGGGGGNFTDNSARTGSAGGSGVVIIRYRTPA